MIVLLRYVEARPGSRSEWVNVPSITLVSRIIFNLRLSVVLDSKRWNLRVTSAQHLSNDSLLLVLPLSSPWLQLHPQPPHTNEPNGTRITVLRLIGPFTQSFLRTNSHVVSGRTRLVSEDEVTVRTSTSQNTRQFEHTSADRVGNPLPFSLPSQLRESLRCWSIAVNGPPPSYRHTHDVYSYPSDGHCSVGPLSNNGVNWCPG